MSGFRPFDLIRKRPSARAPELSPELVAIWSPILERIDDTYEGFEDALISRMIELLSDTTETGESESFKLSNRICVLTSLGTVPKLLQSP